MDIQLGWCWLTLCFVKEKNNLCILRSFAEVFSAGLAS